MSLLNTIQELFPFFRRSQLVTLKMSLVNTIQELFPNLTDIKSLESSSMGTSLKYRAIVQRDDDTLEPEGVIVKLSFTPLHKSCNNQVVECQIYKSVVRQLQKYIPHLPKLYGIKLFDTQAITDRENTNIKAWESEDKSSGQILVIKNVGPTTLWSIWEEESQNPHITFQVLYTIACFERVGLKHNDLHLNNIFIQNYEEPIQFNYQIGDQIVSFKTTKLVKIIDFDRSSIYHKDVERNGYLDELQETEVDEPDERLNQYNGVNNGHDTYRFLKSYSYFNPKKIRIWLNFECPNLFQTEYPDDLPPDINPRNFVPDTLSLLKSLSENFTEHFIVSNDKKEHENLFTLPEDTSVKPVIDKLKFPVSKISRSNMDDGFLYMYKELRALGYNWRLHHCKLFEEVKEYIKVVRPDEKESSIYNACIHVTNPLRNQYYNNHELETLILEKFTPVLIIPQKHNNYDKRIRTIEEYSE
jgi:hypothetical protein